MSRQPFSVEEIRRRTAVDVDGHWNNRIVAGVERRVRRRRLGRASAAVATALLLAGGAWWRLWPERHPSIVLRQPPAARDTTKTTDARIVSFDQGATGRLASSQSDAVVTERSSSRTTVAVNRGAVEFEVERTGREFRVVAGSVQVVVVGTVFVVDRRDEGVRVLVRRGRVTVEVEGEKMTVNAGEERWFPIARPAPPAPVASEASRVRARQGPTPRWRLLAQGGHFQRAYKLLGQPGSKPSDAIEELMLAADVARRSNHFAEALPYYDRVILTHSGDPRAALAALTKARITLHQLGRPLEAAAAFAQARQLSLPEALIEDAMLGEVAAWRRAGERAKAQAVAAEYLRRYPGPSSAENLRGLGDLK